MTKGKGRNPGAGNLDKHIKRTVHKERSQPASRKHLGPLEKHKDHAVRAQRRKVKVQRLLQLKRATAQRNPDEFHIGMTKSITDIASGKVKRRPVSSDEKRENIQKTIQNNTRNVNYLQYKAHADLNRAKELLDEDVSAAITSSAPLNKHIVFVDNDEEFRRFNPIKHFDATPEMLKQHPAVRGRISVLQDTVLPDDVLLAGARVLSASQRRRARREIQQKLQRLGTNDPEARAAFVERHKVKDEMKRYRFSDLVAEVQAEESELADGEARDEVERLLQLRKEKEDREVTAAARRAKEIQQRAERSKSLMSLAKSIKRQNEGMKKSLQQKRDSRFKANTARRAR